MQRGRDQVVAQPAAAAGCLPAQPGQDRLAARGRAPRCRGELVEGGPTQLRRDGAVQLGSEQGHRAAAVVGAPGQPGDPGGREPRLDQVGPALGDVLAQPPVVRRGRQPGFVELAADREQSGSRGDLRDESEPGLVEVERAHRPAAFPDPDAARAQRLGRLGRPELEQVLHEPDHGERRPGGGAVDLSRVAGGQVQGGGLRLCLGVHPAAAQVDPDLAGEHHAVGGRGDQQAPGEQLVDRRVGSRDVDVAPGPLDAAGRRPPGQPGERLAGLGADVRQQPGEAGGVRDDLGDLPGGDERVTGNGQAEVGGEPLEAGRAVSRQRQLGRWTEAGRRTDDLADRSGDEDAGVVAVDEGPHPQGCEGCRRVGAEQVTDPVRRDRVGQRAQHLDDLHREQVELVQGPLDRGTTGGSCRECGDVGGDRVEQVGPGAQELPERGVVARPQVVSQAARPVGGHPSHGSRLSRCPPAA